MRPKLKLNHIRTLHDARYCSAVGVDLLGFSLHDGAEDRLSNAQVAEILEWLSGPGSVGEFTYASPDEILAAATEAKVQWISIPFDYPAPTATELSLPLIFRWPGTLDQEGLERLQQLASQFPDAHFEYSVEDEALWEPLKASQLIQRSLLRFAEPDPIYAMLTQEGIKPFAFSLGDFVEEPDGHLDYESCDEFIEEYQVLTTP